jgi:hypothetical protein
MNFLRKIKRNLLGSTFALIGLLAAGCQGIDDFEPKLDGAPQIAFLDVPPPGNCSACSWSEEPIATTLSIHTTRSSPWDFSVKINRNDSCPIIQGPTNATHGGDRFTIQFAPLSGLSFASFASCTVRKLDFSPTTNYTLLSNGIESPEPFQLTMNWTSTLAGSNTPNVSSFTSGGVCIIGTLPDTDEMDANM